MSRWQRIETLKPIERMRVDLWAGGRRETDCEWHNGAWRKWKRFVPDKRQIAGDLTGTHRYREVRDPTYWMLLPEPPND